MICLLLIALVPVFPRQSTPADSIYDIQDNVLIRTGDGASISAIVVKRKGVTTPLPVILQSTIYVRSRDVNSLKIAVDNGYIGVMAYTRGKRYSPDEVFPYENDSKDTYDVIDWISKQPWCNGKIGMYGGSYNGFTQWAAVKKLHPALKTIVPYAANRPGMGLPVENGIFVNPNYEWAFYVTNNKELDTIVGNDRPRFRKMQQAWWEAGTAYRKIDSVDGTPNKYLQRWLQHPAYDTYWQSMVPYKEEFSGITIPVLVIDGYYNDSQLSSLYYFREHTKYYKNNEDYLIIGPYDHFGSQRGGAKVLNGYEVDTVALINTRKITYEWFDYIFKGGKKPAILQDRINYEVMGANEWRHASSLDKMHNEVLHLYLSDTRKDGRYQLTERKPLKRSSFYQEIDFKDRTTYYNDYYPDPIIRKELDTSNGLFFLSEPFKEPVIVNGAFSGEIKAIINKKDFDLGVVLYEVMPDGTYFELSYFLGRASYAKDITTRHLLTPGKIEGIPFSNTKLVSRQLSKGSRLLAVINVNKNSFSQLNYGTGKDVSDETMDDAGELLKVKWQNDSYIEIPVLKGHKEK
ncbi:CocE/NonD family hydrolase [Chitinophaga tropicalis]|uniref:CocE/NonD family hydrolase n=1 Tax=Chitinophaga tropicalis TaxID=2683588 RepID=UPI0018DFA7D0|nr:CocE/NonD family hydrolase [Chitinophaga tropicalis]